MHIQHGYIIISLLHICTKQCHIMINYYIFCYIFVVHTNTVIIIIKIIRLARLTSHIDVRHVYFPRQSGCATRRRPVFGIVRVAARRRCHSRLDGRWLTVRDPVKLLDPTAGTVVTSLSLRPPSPIHQPRSTLKLAFITTVRPRLPSPIQQQWTPGLVIGTTAQQQSPTLSPMSAQTIWPSPVMDETVNY